MGGTELASNEHDAVDSAHGLLLPFDTDDAAFARGFEAGRLWALARLDPSEPIDVLIHANNIEMAFRIAEATGRPITGEEVDATWVAVSMQAAEAETA